jgi:hypothetical protein
VFVDVLSAIRVPPALYKTRTKPDLGIANDRRWELGNGNSGQAVFTTVVLHVETLTRLLVPEILQRVRVVRSSRIPENYGIRAAISDVSIRGSCFSNFGPSNLNHSRLR